MKRFLQLPAKYHRLIIILSTLNPFSYLTIFFVFNLLIFFIATPSNAQSNDIQCQLHKLPSYLMLNKLIHISGYPLIKNDEAGFKCSVDYSIDDCLFNSVGLPDYLIEIASSIDLSKDPSLAILISPLSNQERSSHISYHVDDNGFVSKFSIAIFKNGPGYVPFNFERESLHNNGWWRSNLGECANLQKK